MIGQLLFALKLCALRLLMIRLRIGHQTADYGSKAKQESKRYSADAYAHAFVTHPKITLSDISRTKAVHSRIRIGIELLSDQIKQIRKGYCLDLSEMKGLCVNMIESYFEDRRTRLQTKTSRQTASFTCKLYLYRPAKG